MFAIMTHSGPDGVAPRTGLRLCWRYPEIEPVGADGHWLDNVDHTVEDTDGDGDGDGDVASLAVG